MTHETADPGSFESAPGIKRRFSVPDLAGRVNRGGWRIEGQSGVLDRGYEDGRSRVRSGHARENVSQPPRLANSAVLDQFQKPE